MFGQISGTSHGLCKSRTVLSGGSYSRARTMIHRLQAYLVQEKGLKLLTYQQVIHCSVQNGKAEVLTSFGNKLLAHNVIICNGSEFKTLYPELFAQSDMEVTKLQMLQTVPQPSDYILP